MQTCCWQLGDGWVKWKAQTRLLRSALLSRSSDSHMMELISGCLELYEASTNRQPNTEDALASISGRNVSLLETAYMWLGDWRPTSAIILVYSNLGIGIPNLDGQAVSATEIYSSACVLSEPQVMGMEALWGSTRQAEVDLSDKLATLQMLVADQSMIEALSLGDSSINVKDLTKGHQVMETKVAALEDLFTQANQLRLQTLQELSRLLHPAQSAQCSIAAFELAFAIKALGSASLQGVNHCTWLPRPSPIILPNLDASISNRDSLLEGAGVTLKTLKQRGDDTDR